MAGYLVSATVSKLEVFNFVIVTGEPVIDGDAVVSTNRNSQVSTRFAQQYVRSCNAFTEQQGVITAFLTDSVVTVTFVEEVSVVTGTTDQDVVADTAV